MGVYVRMQMPKNCYDCNFCRHYDEPNQGYCCVAWLIDLHNVDIQKERCQACPLVEVPEPHGDLIDKSELTYCSYDLDNYFWFRAVPEETVESAKVIIPASKEE